MTNKKPLLDFGGALYCAFDGRVYRTENGLDWSEVPVGERGAVVLETTQDEVRFYQAGEAVQFYGEEQAS